MSNSIKTFNAAPQASILIESMRDIGYGLETALADIIDNSITAGAKKIDLLVSPEENNAKVGILDNGQGMSEDELLIAMRPGSQNPLNSRNTSDLGRFGLGLKTASFSQCRKITVVSRKNGKISAAIWDIDYVARVNDWLVQVPENLESILWADKLEDSGTLILWENLDRVIGKDASDNKGNLASKIEEACKHLELVFHRFISKEQGVPTVEININNRPLKAFDPFNSKHPATIEDPDEVIRFNEQDIILKTFTLPHHRKVTPREWEYYAGKEGYLKNQGFYVYREKRLIIYGTWFGLARQTELTKLARVRIDMPNGLDSEWKIDVKKASANPPMQVRERLRKIIESIGGKSKRIYTQRGKKLTADSRLPVWNRIQYDGEIVYEINKKYPLLLELSAKLTNDQSLGFWRIVELIESTLPMDAIFADLSNTPEQIGEHKITDETLKHTLECAVRSLKGEGVSEEDLVQILKLAEPFRSHQERTEIFLNNLINGDATNDQ